MTTFETSIDILAPPARVWDVVADIGRWPEWTPSVITVAALDRGHVGVGSRYRLRQPGNLPAVWTVSDWRPGAGFVWVTRMPGLEATAEHEIDPVRAGTRLTLRVTFRGALAPLVARLAGPMTRRFLRMESEGCRERSEAAARGTNPGS